MLRGALEPLPYVLSHGPSSALVNAAVDTKISQSGPTCARVEMCMERHCDRVGTMSCHGEARQ